MSHEAVLTGWNANHTSLSTGTPQPVAAPSSVASAFVPETPPLPVPAAGIVEAWAQLSLTGGEQADCPPGVNRRDVLASAAKVPPLKLEAIVPVWSSTPVVAP